MFVFSDDIKFLKKIGTDGIWQFSVENVYFFFLNKNIFINISIIKFMFWFNSHLHLFLLRKFPS